MAVLEESTRKRRRARSRTLIGAALALFALAAAVVAVIAAGDDGGGGDEQAGAQPALVTPGALLEQPARWLRRDVTVAGEIGDVVGPGAYLVGDATGPFDDGLLVLTRDRRGVPQAQRPLLENDSVQVSGEVRTFDKAELEQQLGRPLEDDLAERDGDPVLVADQIVVVPRLLPIAEPATIGSILERPRKYTGSIVVVRGRVSGVYGRGALVLDGRMAVLLSGTVEELPRRGDRVAVTGAVRTFDRDELTARTRDDIDDDLFGDLAERPAVVAWSIERGAR